MTVCTHIPSWWGLILGILVLIAGFYWGVYRVQKKIQRRSMKIVYCIAAVLLVLLATFAVLAVTSTDTCAVRKPHLINDYDTQINSRQEAEVIFASYFKTKYPEGVSLKYLDRGIEEDDNAYYLWEGTNIRLILHKDGKLYRKFIGE